MDPTMIIGVVAGLGFIIFGIGFGNLGDFANFPSVIIVVGGTFAVLVASFPLSALKNIPKQIRIALDGVLPNPGLYIDQIFDCAQVARKHGLLALEELANAQDDEFMKDSLLLIVDAVDSDKVRYMLEADLSYLDERHAGAVTFFEKGASYAPAFGMIGTLIGLILMLANLTLDAEDAADTLTSGMAVALITTFYGSLLSNFFFAPIATKLQAKHDREMLCKRIIIEGALSIQAGENPKFIREKLISFLPQKERRDFIASGGGTQNIKAKDQKANKDKKEKEKKEKGLGILNNYVKKAKKAG